MSVFYLPDLGEGLPDAEILQWFVKEGDVVDAEQPLVEMETAKAVVEVPSPQSGRIAKLHGKPNDIMETGSALVTFSNAEKITSTAKDDEISQPIESDATNTTSKPAIAPHVAALAKKLNVELSNISGTGKNNSITLEDVRNAQKNPQKQIAKTKGNAIEVDFSKNTKIAPKARKLAKDYGIDIQHLKHSGHQDNITLKDIQNKRVHQPAISPADNQVQAYSLPERTQEVTGKPQQLRGERRIMALNMANARDKAVTTTICEKAEITQWPTKSDISVRLIRAVTAACMVEPSLNAWFDGKNTERTLHKDINIGIAVDSPHGLSVPVIHNAELLDAQQLREKLNYLREAVYTKTIKPEELKNATITLSNFGMIAGLYATPIVTPPQVAIVATGRIMEELKLTEYGIVNARYIPISLSFDHCGATGADAARFLAAFVADLSLPN